MGNTWLIQHKFIACSVRWYAGVLNQRDNNTFKCSADCMFSSFEQSAVQTGTDELLTRDSRPSSVIYIVTLPS